MKGLTQEQMAQILHKSQNSYSMIEAGKSKLDASLIPVIAKVFGITPTEFFEFEKPAATKQPDYIEIINVLKRELDMKNKIILEFLKLNEQNIDLREKNASIIYMLNMTANRLNYPAVHD